ncbi:MAG: hypothetical protein M5U34_39215 [Chloroflexi bacterium]|nr:hypothetical protein [Chloroflexota bacterium]
MSAFSERGHLVRLSPERGHLVRLSPGAPTSCPPFAGSADSLSALTVSQDSAPF